MTNFMTNRAIALKLSIDVRPFEEQADASHDLKIAMWRAGWRYRERISGRVYIRVDVNFIRPGETHGFHERGKDLLLCVRNAAAKALGIDPTTE